MLIDHGTTEQVSAPRDAKTRRRSHHAAIGAPRFFEQPDSVFEQSDPVERARAAGVTAVWTGTCSATVELARLAGPIEGTLAAGECARYQLPGEPPLQLADPEVRIALYEHCLTAGTQFDIYRWINLRELATYWDLLTLPAGVRREWECVLSAAGLLESAQIEPPCVEEVDSASVADCDSAPRKRSRSAAA